MFDLNAVQKRYFEFLLPDCGKVCYVEPPKIKTMKLLEDTEHGLSMEDGAKIIAKILSKNKHNRKITPDQVMDWMDTDQMGEFLRSYIRWLKKEKASDPNS